LPPIEKEQRKTMPVNSFIVHLMGQPAAHSQRLPKLTIPLATLAMSALLGLSLASHTSAQAVAQCQPTAPALYPPFVDTTTTTPGWDPDTSPYQAKTKLVLGDVDGDGDQEIVALNQGQIQLWHWIQTGWTPMVAFPNAQVIAHAPHPNETLTGEQINLADVNGDGQQEIIVYAAWTGSRNSAPYYQEQVYHYNKYTDTWALLVSDQVAAPSYWFKAHTTDIQESRLLGWVPGGFKQIQVQHLSGNAWIRSSYSFDNGLSALGFQSQCVQTGGAGACIALYDVTGDGIADLIALGDNGITYVVPSTSRFLFGGTMVESKIPKVAVTGDQVNATTIQGWQLNQGLLIVPTVIATDDIPTFPLNVYTWINGDFAAISDPNQELTKNEFSANPGLAYGNDGALTYTLTVLPQATAANAQLVFIGESGVYNFPLAAQAGQLTVGTPEFVTADISPLQGFFAPGYSGYFHVAAEGAGLAMIARSPQGIVTRVPKSTAAPSLFVNPETLTDRGYPKYTAGQLLAYQYIGANTAGNPDLRAIYGDPAVSWANIQAQVENLAAPPTAAGIALADFQFAQKQTIAEVAALQSVNLLFAATGTILTNTYLVKDATLSEVTDVLGLPAQPDVTGAVINDVTAGLNSLGAAAEGAAAILTSLKDIAATLNNSGSVLELLGTITGDIATYTISNPIAFDSYDLKTQLDNSALGAVTANACHQVSTLSSWSQSKPIADGLLTGALPLDLDTQQTILEATQSLFQLNVWQALVPSKWEYVAVRPDLCEDFSCTFNGNANYPVSDAAQAYCTNDLAQTFPVSLVLFDSTNNNYPNLFALNSLFDTPPLGLGENAPDVMSGSNGWALTYVPKPSISLNTNTGLNTQYCENLQVLPASDAVTAVTAAVTPAASSAKAVSKATPAVTATTSLSGKITKAIKSLTTLSTQVTAAHTDDAGFSQRMVMYLSVTISRLQHNQLLNQQPKEALQLLNTFIAQSQWHATLKQSDSKASGTEASKAVAVRDSLLALIVS
jgi:hypothetical protein